jgi:heat shock protein HslJ
MDYTPVCASVQVQCIKAPCNPIQETFGNACMMHANTHATYLYDGECKIDTLDKTSWDLQSFDDKIATGAELTFESGSISAHVCNSYNGSYTINENTLVVGPMMSTKMACM